VSSICAYRQAVFRIRDGWGVAGGEGDILSIALLEPFFFNTCADYTKILALLLGIELTNNIEFTLLYRVSINCFSDYKHLLQENFMFHIRRFSALDNFPTRWCTSTLGFTCSSVFGCNRWFERDGPTPWPPRSPDITPVDFVLWRYVKDKVFSTPVQDITNPKAIITDAFGTITEHMLENTWRETDCRLDFLRATKEAHVVVY